VTDEQVIARPGQIVVHLKWAEPDGVPRQETFGPWTAAGDDSHLGPITAFMRDWSRLVSDGARDAVMELVTAPVLAVDPGEWVRQREAGNDG